MLNKNHVRNLKRGSDGLVIELFDYPHEVHVSRQYAVNVKEALKEV